MSQTAKVPDFGSVGEKYKNKTVLQHTLQNTAVDEMSKGPLRLNKVHMRGQIKPCWTEMRHFVHVQTITGSRDVDVVMTSQLDGMWLKNLSDNHQREPCIHGSSPNQSIPQHTDIVSI